MDIDLSLERRRSDRYSSRGTGKPRPSPWKAMFDALLRLAEDQAAIVRHAERPWASVTFSGTRHEVALTFAGAEAVSAAERFIAALPEHEFTIPHQLVAEAAVVAVDHRLLPEASMTVECQLILLDDEG